MITRIFPGRLESLSLIAEYVRGEGETAGLSDKALFELETAVDEAVSNIIEHSYGGEDIGEVICTCDQLTSGIQVILEDFGQPFDPACIPVPNLSAALKDRKNNGLGYYLMCQLMDEVKFDFYENHNRLTLTKLKE